MTEASDAPVSATNPPRSDPDGTLATDGMDFSDGASQYLTFNLGTEQYGLRILRVQEIVGLTRVTPLPHCPEFVRGVINLRGAVIPVVDLRLRFGLPVLEYTPQTVVIIAVIDTRKIGFIVDGVTDVADIPADRIEPTPEFARRQVDTRFVSGVAHQGDALTILLDAERVLSEDEKLQLGGSALDANG